MYGHDADLHCCIWGGGTAGTFEANAPLTVTASVTETHEVEAEQYKLTVIKGTNMQSVTGEGWYDSGTVATASGTPKATYTDTGSTYTVDPNNSGHRYHQKYTYTVVPVEKTMDSAQTVTVNATETKSNGGGDQYKLTVNKDAGVNSVTVKVGDTTISPATSGGNTYWIDKSTNPTVEATAKSGYIINGGAGSVGEINANKSVNVTSELATALKFSSDAPFTLSVICPIWDGTIEYSTDNGDTWSTWNGSQLSGNINQNIYLRGINNTRITYAGGNDSFIFTGKYCTGNIETLLDYQTVANGQHPIMATNCYALMFYDCASLTTAPELPATTLANNCYYNMFLNCTSLTTVPKLPATTLAESCYMSMFAGCSSLKLSTTRTGAYQYAYRIPTTGTGTTASNALMMMFDNTGGTFTGTPTINTTYYTDHQPVG